MKNHLLRTVAVAVLTLSIGSGVASAAAGTIGTTGPNSNNQVTVDTSTHRQVHNNNRVMVSSDSSQAANSGSSVVQNNTTGGGATTGAVANNNTTSASVAVSNAGSSAAALGASMASADTGTINNTGPNSNNQVSFDTHTMTSVKNDNCVSVTSSSTQNASSGSATVYGNTTGGSAVSGSASNANTTQTTVSISN